MLSFMHEALSFIKKVKYHPAGPLFMLAPCPIDKDLPYQ